MATPSTQGDSGFAASFGTSEGVGEYGQIRPLTTPLRNVLRDYSGAQVLGRRPSSRRVPISRTTIDDDDA